jgi:hypothetical protein
MIQTKKYSFFYHPNSVCLSYFQHMRLSFFFATQFMLGASKSIIHAFFPNLYKQGSLNTITVVSNKLESVGCNRPSTIDFSIIK